MKKDRRRSFFLPSDNAYEAMKLFWKLMNKAENRLAIIDEYLDEQIFDYIDSLDEKLEIQLLTGKRKKIFKRLYDALQAKRANMEARENQDCHDRFLIIDDNYIWHSGNSFNGIGKKAFQVNKLQDEAERQKFFAYHKNWWANGTLI